MNDAPTVVLNARAVARTISRMADEILELNDGTERLVLVGIQRRGVQIAERLAEVILERERTEIPRGALDITLYRDDLQTVGPRPVVGKTHLPVPLDGKVVVIVDDVLFTGRTIRAALDALSDIGRPRSVQLAVLVDRGHRDLPIRPDFVGKNLPTSVDEQVRVSLAEVDSIDEVTLDGRSADRADDGSAS